MRKNFGKTGPADSAETLFFFFFEKEILKSKKNLKKRYILLIAPYLARNIQNILWRKKFWMSYFLKRELKYIAKLPTIPASSLGNEAILSNEVSSLLD